MSNKHRRVQVSGPRCQSLFSFSPGLLTSFSISVTFNQIIILFRLLIGLSAVINPLPLDKNQPPNPEHRTRSPYQYDSIHLDVGRTAKPIGPSSTIPSFFVLSYKLTVHTYQLRPSTEQINRLRRSSYLTPFPLLRAPMDKKHWMTSFRPLSFIVSPPINQPTHALVCRALSSMRGTAPSELS
ncbi:hypothetical protein QBC45DRAFT_398940 [Copromyces sp. CBS 386.78]|nr:hypothetical protein QBC45DRAFT_398940 [Copromyces sp. CBS 386.78]